MRRLSTGLALAATLLLGLSAGAMLAEGVVLVSYWRSLPAEEFLGWFARYEPALVVFFGSLQTASAIAALAAFGALQAGRQRGRLAASVAALLSIAALALFFVYFRDVNASFVAHTIPVDEVAAELGRWERWQWARIGVGTGAFAAALAAVRRTGKDEPVR